MLEKSKVRYGSFGIFEKQYKGSGSGYTAGSHFDGSGSFQVWQAISRGKLLWTGGQEGSFVCWKAGGKERGYVFT